MFWWRNEVRPGVSVAFTDTGAGNLALHVGDNPSEVLARRVRVEQAAGLEGGKFQYMNQVHGNTVEFIEIHGPGPTADAMVSAVTVSSASAVLHSHWRSWWLTVCPWFSWETVPITNP